MAGWVPMVARLGRRGAATFHLHGLAQRHLVLDAILVVPPGAVSPLAEDEVGEAASRWYWGPRHFLGGVGGKPKRWVPEWAAVGVREATGAAAAPAPQPRPPGTQRQGPRSLRRPRGAGVSWRRGHGPGVVVVRGGRGEGCLAAVQPGQPRQAASVAGTFGLRSGGLRGEGASGCAGGARTPLDRDPSPETTGNIIPSRQFTRHVRP